MTEYALILPGNLCLNLQVGVLRLNLMNFHLNCLSNRPETQFDLELL